VAAPASVLHGAEEALLTELLYHRRLARLGLRQLAPAVLASRLPPEETLAALRAEGYAPVAEHDEARVRVERPERHRAAAPRAMPGPRRTAPPRTTTATNLEHLTARLLSPPPPLPETRGLRPWTPGGRGGGIGGAA
jgi:hypothetical protein